MSLSRAQHAMERLESALAEELARSKAEPKLLGNLDGEALFQRANEREAFRRTGEALQRELVLALGKPDGSVEIPSELRAKWQRIQLMAAQLKESDRTMRELYSRGLRVVRGFLRASDPEPAAYNGRGAALAPSSTATHSFRG